MSGRVLAIVGILAFLLFALISLPLASALWLFAPAALDYDSAHGTIWDGGLSGARLGGSDLGRVTIALDPLPMLWLTVSASWTATGGDLGGNGHVRLSPLSGTGVEDTRLRMPARLLPLGVELAGGIEVSIDDLHWSGGCEAVSGKISADMLRESADLLNWAGPVLTGTMACEDGILLLPLAGRQSGTTVNSLARLQPDGVYILDVDVSTRSEELEGPLLFMGFQGRAPNFRYREHGQWQ